MHPQRSKARRRARPPHPMIARWKLNIDISRSPKGPPRRNADPGGPPILGRGLDSWAEQSSLLPCPAGHLNHGHGVSTVHGWLRLSAPERKLQSGAAGYAYVAGSRAARTSICSARPQAAAPRLQCALTGSQPMMGVPSALCVRACSTGQANTCGLLPPRSGRPQRRPRGYCHVIRRPARVVAACA